MIVSRKTVAASMRRQSLQGLSPRKFAPVTTIADRDRPALPDLVKREWDTGQLNQVWTSDMPPRAGGAPSYLATGQGWLYLCAVRDGCSRRVIGWAVAEHMRTSPVTAAQAMAVAFRGDRPATVVFHAYRGTQYTSREIGEYAAAHGLACSVGRSGACWDNAQQESYWSSLKTEFYDRRGWPTRAEAATAVGDWIEGVHNRRRRHSALGTLTPVRFEQPHRHTAQAP